VNRPQPASGDKTMARFFSILFVVIVVVAIKVAVRAAVR
jgi:hypothetical protein